ncbi:MAG: NAD(P)/FAD-dependent oxidoreductase [Kiloniellaceae bacterium]
MTVPGKDSARHHVTVIGAGIVGIASALNLQRAGFDVTVIDKEPPGEGASRGNAGIMAPCAIVPVTTPGIWKKAPGMLLDPMGPLSLKWSYILGMLPWLADYLSNSSPRRVEAIASGLSNILSGSVEEHQQLARDTKAEQWINPSPYIYLYPDERAYLKESFAWNLRKAHGARFAVLKNGEVQDMDPAISPNFTFALVLEGHGFVRDPLRLVHSLAEDFARKGGTILQREVTDIEIGIHGPERLLTPQGPIEIETLVIAAGAWSGKLAAQLGSPVPLESERGYHVVLTDPGITPKYPIMSTSGKFVATPMAMGLRLAGLVEFAGLEAAPNYKLARTLLKHARQLFPGVRTEQFTEWMGHRPALPDSLPVIGRSPKFENVFFAFGHQHVGLTGGPKTGRLISEMIQGRTPNIDMEPYSIMRFAG